MSSCELSDPQCDEWANFQETQDIENISMPFDPLAEYEQAMRTTQLFFNLNQISPEVLKHHRITITHNTNIAQFFKVYQKDCYITIKKRHHFGTHCIYDVVLANFTLEIHLLNLHRSSDDNNATLSEHQIGKGGFGSVRVVRAGSNTVAVKRIDFIKKAKGVDGFDIQIESAELKQIRKAIREYCLYKICSMLKIGPEVIFQSNYDLICFNNCIEFIMELCQNPCKNPNFMSQRGLSVQKLQEDLMQNLKLLHSLNIIHKDIKPDNILYSDSLQRFVFTDFGITHAVKEKFNEKTLTHFAGTPDYSSQQMKQLINQPKGQVNLYLNDFEGLKKSISKLASEVKNSSSLSQNAMSFKNQSQDISYGGCKEEQMQLPTSFDEWFQSEVTESSTQRRQNIYITSTHSLDAPMKYASEINFFQSLILYRIFQTNELMMRVISRDLKSVEINGIIDEYIDQIDNAEIEKEIRRYVLSIFYPSQENLKLTLRMIDLKNTARNFGPKHEQTLQKIDEILLEIDSGEPELLDYFKSVKQSIIGDPQKLSADKFQQQIMINIYLKNYNYFIGCSLRIIREAASFKKRKVDQGSPQDKKTFQKYLPFLCKLYILSQRINAMTISENKTLNELFLKLWDEDQIEDVNEFIRSQEDVHNYNKEYDFAQNPSNNRIVARMMRHAIEYILKSQKTTTFQIIQVFNFLICRFSWTKSDDYNFYQQFISKIEQHLGQHQGQSIKNSHKVELAKIYRKICKMEDHAEIDKRYYIEKIRKITNEFKLMDDKKYYFTCLIQLIWIYYETRQIDDLNLSSVVEVLNELQAYQCPQIQKKYAIIQINHAIGSLYYLFEKYSEGLIYLKNTQRFIISFYGSQNLMESYYRCLSNIAFGYYQLKDYENALAYYQGILDYLSKTKKAISFEKSLVYRSILVIRLKIGVSKQDFPQIENIIKIIVYQTIFTIVSMTTSEYQLQRYNLGIQIFNFIYKPSDVNVKIFVMKTLLKYIENHLNYFLVPYDKINYQLYKIYAKELKEPFKCYPFIWNYIKVKIQKFHKVTVEDFKLMNDFITKLIKINSSRRALLLLRRYIFHIPLSMFKERQKAFKLFHRVHVNIGHPFQKIIYQLVANECENLYSKDFSKIYRPEIDQSAILKNLLLKKWLSRV